MHVYLISIDNAKVIGYSDSLLSMKLYVSNNGLTEGNAVITSSDQFMDWFRPDQLGELHNAIIGDPILIFNHDDDDDDEDALQDMADEIWECLINNVLDYEELPKTEQVATPVQDMTLNIAGVDIDIKGYAADEPIVIKPVVMTYPNSSMVIKPIVMEQAPLPMAVEVASIEPMEYITPSRGSLEGVRFRVGDYTPGKTTHYWILDNFVFNYYETHKGYPTYSQLVKAFLDRYKGKVEPKDKKLATKFIRGAIRRGFLNYKLR